MYELIYTLWITNPGFRSLLAPISLGFVSGAQIRDFFQEPYEAIFNQQIKMITPQCEKGTQRKSISASQSTGVSSPRVPTSNANIDTVHVISGRHHVPPH